MCQTILNMETFTISLKNKQEKRIVKAFLDALRIKIDGSKTNTEFEYSDTFKKTMTESIQNLKDGRVTKLQLDDIWK